MNYRLLYFASLADRAGRGSEDVQSTAIDPAALYVELAARHGFGFARERLRVAVNGAFASWSHALVDGDEVAFIPPVSGG